MLTATSRVKLLAQKAFQQPSPYHLASLRKAPCMSTIIWEIERALEKGMVPAPNDGGTSESYRMLDCDGEAIAIFKPMRRPKSFDITREIVAYYLDHDRFAGVPPTVFASFSHPFFQGMRSGSCQLFIHGCTPLVYLEKSLFKQLSPEQVRRIALLDIRLLNPDRHTSNLLFQREDKAVVPIDHGAVLPEHFYGTHFVWMAWEQIKTPFSKEEKEYVSSLDPEKDARLLLEELGFSMRISQMVFLVTSLLKKAVALGLNAFEIGDMQVRHPIQKEDGKTEWIPSLLEPVLKKIQERSYSDWNNFNKEIDQEVEQFLENYETHQHQNQIAAR